MAAASRDAGQKVLLLSPASLGWPHSTGLWPSLPPCCSVSSPGQRPGPRSDGGGRVCRDSRRCGQGLSRLGSGGGQGDGGAADGCVRFQRTATAGCPRPAWQASRVLVPWGMHAELRGRKRVVAGRTAGSEPILLPVAGLQVRAPKGARGARRGSPTTRRGRARRLRT